MEMYIVVLVSVVACIAGASLDGGGTVPCDIGDPNFVWDSTLKECLQIGNDTLLSKCKSDLQCLKSSLGKLSRCSPENGLCECYDWDSHGRAATICFNEKCYVKKHLEDFCSEDEECQAGVHVDAVCVKHQNFLPHETVCMCPEGRSCKNLGDTCDSDRECVDGVSSNAVCTLHIGERVCVCPEGRVCVKEMRESSSNIGTLAIVGIVVGVLGTIAILVVAVVFILRCRKTDYFV